MSDVLIIGGGVIGCATAWYLSREGVSVTLIEAGDLNTQASGTNSGSLHGQIPHDTYLQHGDDWARMFLPTLKLLRESIRLWQEADTLLDTDLEVKVGGGLLLAASPQELSAMERKLSLERSAGLGGDMLDAAELQRVAPYVSRQLAGALFCPGEGKANPLIAAPAFARAAAQAGAAVHPRTAVQGISRDGPGYIVHTDRGDFRGRRLVNAAGANAARVCAMLGVELKLEGFPIQVSVTEPVEPVMQHLLYYTRAPLTMKQTAVGSIIVGGGWPARYDSRRRPVADPESLGPNLGLALEVMPQLAPVNIVRTWAATVNGTPDWMPVIGELPGVSGAFLAYFPWMGFTGGPATGRLVASLLLGRESPFDLDVGAFAPGGR
jgi:glycine/D-amino acid oxidase-like deaminating enzyme